MATPTTLPATFVSGDVLTAAQMNDLRGAFRVLQIVHANYSTSSSNSTSTYADTGLTATITPTSTSSKVLVFVNQAGCGKESNNVYLKLRLLRDASEIIKFEDGAGKSTAAQDNYVGSCSTTYLDSPNTTSATTYKTQFSANTNAALVRVQYETSTSTITLMEISA
jgi:hypothetical protein